MSRTPGLTPPPAGSRPSQASSRRGRRSPIAAEHGPADVVSAANTLCHIPYLDEIFAGLDALLVEPVDVAPLPTHGGEVRYTLARSGRHPVSPAVTDLIGAEARSRLHELDTLRGFAAEVARRRGEWPGSLRSRGSPRASGRDRRRGPSRPIPAGRRDGRACGANGRSHSRPRIRPRPGPAPRAGRRGPVPRPGRDQPDRCNDAAHVDLCDAIGADPGLCDVALDEGDDVGDRLAAAGIDDLPRPRVGQSPQDGDGLLGREREVEPGDRTPKVAVGVHVRGPPKRGSPSGGWRTATPASRRSGLHPRLTLSSRPPCPASLACWRRTRWCGGGA